MLLYLLVSITVAIIQSITVIEIAAEAAKLRASLRIGGISVIETSTDYSAGTSGLDMCLVANKIVYWDTAFAMPAFFLLEETAGIFFFVSQLSFFVGHTAMAQANVHVAAVSPMILVTSFL